MAAASSSAVEETAVDEVSDIDLPSDLSGQNESSDPDFDPASQAETLLMSLHDRMIISMSPIPKIEVFLGNKSRSCHLDLSLFTLLGSLGWSMSALDFPASTAYPQLLK